MSGYRTLHRIQPEDSSTSAPSPVWRVKFSPCQTSSTNTQSSLRLMAAGASNKIQCYKLTDRTAKDANSNDVLDASAMSVENTDCLVSNDDYNTIVASSSDENVKTKNALGYASLEIIRNYCGSDKLAGNEIVVSSQLGGKVCIWVRLDPILIDKGVVVADDTQPSTTTIDNMKCISPHAEFTVKGATGTTLAIRPTTLSNYYSKKDTDILVALGCANGSVIICKSGVLAARPGAENATGTSNAVVGDSSATEEETINILSNSTPGEVVATIGGGHACVMSLAFHPTIPNCFVVGRKDGIVDIYSSAITDDYYHSGELSFRRMHRLVQSAYPIRALSFSQPDGALLFAGDDNGTLYSYDASCNNERTNMAAPVKLVACALTAHKGWIMNLTAFPDGKRVATCGSDRSIRVWDCGMGLSSSTSVHSFDGVHEGLVWGVDCGSANGEGDKLKLVSCGNDGVMQVFSCGE